MKSIYLTGEQIESRSRRNEAFWRDSLTKYPIMWITAPSPKAGLDIAEPACEESLWTDVEYVIKSAHARLAQTYFAGDSLPVCNPWLGPDQVAAWLGADLLLKPRDNTSWARSFVEDWVKLPALKVDPDNHWWRLYLDLLKASAEFGKDKWITGFPDLHTGIDALCAIRGPENLMLDLLAQPGVIKERMGELTELWRWVVDTVEAVLAPYRQGFSNWTMGYSASRFLCIGQNDFSCMISPKMFEEFCFADCVETCAHSDFTLYHLDGPGAIKHLPLLLEIEKLTAIQWVQGAGSPAPGQWLGLVRRIQGAGKLVQVLYSNEHALVSNEMIADLEHLLRNVDPTRLFIWGDVRTPAEADDIIGRIIRTIDRG
jgi:hypothetical protein